MKTTYFNWSTGKDSALALYHLLKNDRYHVDQLITCVNTHYDRVSMHGLRCSLMQQQVQAIGIPHGIIEFTDAASMEEYEARMKKLLHSLKSNGYTTAAFGDIFLEDLKAYRETQLAEVGINAIFPLWQRDTKELLHEFIALGFKSVVVCINGNALDKSYTGRVIDYDFLNDLPDHVDPCGENGEFHTFCFDGPIFKYPVSFEVGEKIYREYDDLSDPAQKIGFWFCDLLEK